MWRLAYGMPATDPRYLDATEDEVLHDLLVRAHVADAASLANMPPEARDPKVAESFKAVVVRLRDDPRLQPLPKKYGAPVEKPPDGPPRGTTGRPRSKVSVTFTGSSGRRGGRQ